jgi:hypothetical protein
MKNILAIALLALAFTASAQSLTIEPVGKKFILVKSFEKDNGDVRTERIGQKIPLDTARARAEIAAVVSDLASQIAGLELQLSRLNAEKALAEQAYAVTGAVSVEEDNTAKLAAQFIGRYAFETAKGPDTLFIRKKDAGTEKERLVASLASGGKGTLKIESQSTALVLSLFKDSKKKLTDVKILLVEADLFIAELEGQKLKFQKLPPEKAAKPTR